MPANLLSRRRFLGQLGTGLRSIALTHLLAQDRLLGDDTISSIIPQVDPLRPNRARQPHFPPAVDQVLVLFCVGACSHLDTWDHKPKLWEMHDKPMPGGEGLVTFQGEQGTLQRSPWQFKPRGETGKMVSTLVENLAQHTDEMCFIHSMTSKTNTHGPGENFMSTGFTLEGFPSIGSWASYALGSENENLPAYVAIPDPRGTPQSSVNNWGPGFLPAAFQGTAFNAARPVSNLARPAKISAASDLATRQFLLNLNRQHQQIYPGDTQLAARIASYELAAKMQISVPAISDLTTESAHTLRAYGANDTSNPVKAGFAKNCILARRLLEQGVRFVQLFNGAYQTGGEGTSNWDGHKRIQQQYDVHGPILDQPAAALLTDLRQRGMLERTLVVWCTEFGRMPTFQKGASGRDHNPDGFTAWLMGAGVKPGYSHGATDEFGYRAVEQVTTVHDLHATILHLLGLDHRRLTYYHNGIDRRLTDVHGNVIKDILRHS